MFLPQRGRMSAQLTGEGGISSCFYLLVVIRHSPSSPASRELPPLGEAQRAAEGSPLPAGVGRLCLPVGGGGSGLLAVRNRKGRHPEALKPTKDPGGAGADSGVSMDIHTAPPSLP